MMYKIKLSIISILLAIVIPTSFARPARRGPIELKQPDGSMFMASIKGDEWGRIKTTLDGHAIIQEQDGWWCYATYDHSGAKSSTGYRVGNDTPAEIMIRSLNIPRTAIAANAAKRRAIATALSDSEPLLTRISRSKGIMTRADAGQEPVIKHGIVILAEYKDVKFDNKKEAFVNLLTQKGYNLNGAIGSAKEYFDDQFNGMVEFSFDVSDIVTLSQDRAYYGGNDSDDNDLKPADMIAEACSLAFAAGVDFTKYDDDKDGEVDNVFVFFAGGDEAEGAGDDCIWSHAWYLIDGAGIRPSTVTFDGIRVNRYACTAELTRTRTGDRLAGIGTFCHEYSHTFGLPDFYDTDYDERGGWAAGLWGNTSLMDSGNQNNNGNTPPYFNAIERELLGLNEPEVLEKAGTYRMSPIDKGGGFYRINTDTEDEYYLLECREEAGWDSYIGGSGMLIYHIDRSQEVLKKWISSNDLNADFTHQCADLIEADSRVDSFSDSQDMYDRTRNLKGLFFPYNDVTSFTNESSPGIKFWSGRMSTWGITAIKKEGKDIKFNFVDENAIAAPPSPINMAYRSFADAAIINFESSYVYDGEAVLTWKRTGQEGETISIAPYKPGKYCVILEGLEPGGKTYDVEVHFAAEGMEGESGKISFMTKRMPPVEWPYIYLTGSPKNSNGTFSKGTRIPLRVYNAGDAAEIIWYFNGRQVTHEGDGYYTLEKDGTLKAEVLWEDGSKEVIVKEITIGS